MQTGTVSRLDGEARNDFWSSSGDFMYRHYVEPRVKLYVPREGIISYSIEIHWRSQNYRYIFGCNGGEEHRWLLERWWRWRVVRYVDTFHNVHCIKWKTSDGYTWCGERLSRKQTTSRPDTLWPEIWKDMSEALNRKEKQKWALEKPRLDNALKLRGIYFIDPADEEVKDIMKNARRMLEVPMPVAMPCKTRRDKNRETCRTIGGHKTKYACIVEAGESTRKRLEGIFIKIMKTTLQGKESIHWTTTISCTNLFLCLTQWKDQMRKLQWTKNGKLEKIGMAADESQKQKGGDRWSKEWGQNSTLRVVNGRLSFEEFGVGATVSTIQRSSRIPRWHCERWFRLECSIYKARFIGVTNVGCKSNCQKSRLPGCTGQATDAVSAYT